MKGQIVIYTIVGCHHCNRARSFFDEKKLEYIDINLDQHADARKWLVENTGQKTVPQIFFNERHIGGNNELQKLDQEELQRLIMMVLYTENQDPDVPFVPRFDEEVDAHDQEELEVEFTCELDEYAELVEELQESGLVRDHKKGIKTYKNSFVGKDVVDWLLENKDIDRETATNIGQQLVERHFGKSVKRRASTPFKDDNTIYHFISNGDSNALNAWLHTQCEPRPAPEVAEELRQVILSMYSEHISSDGKSVNYKGIPKHPLFSKYIQLIAELKRVRLEETSREEKLAFFINIYNAMVIHACIAVGPPTNLWKRYKFFNSVTYVIGGYSYSLNDIENGILRANRKAIGSFKKPFAKSDARLEIALDSPEPKIHFALVCGAKSCPPIRTYSAADIHQQLQLATESFVEGDDVKVDKWKAEVKISKIFKWYREDFGDTNRDVLLFIYDHMSETVKRKNLKELLDKNTFKLTYVTYDWKLNSNDR